MSSIAADVKLGRSFQETFHPSVKHHYICSPKRDVVTLVLNDVYCSFCNSDFLPYLWPDDITKWQVGQHFVVKYWKPFFELKPVSALNLMNLTQVLLGKMTACPS